MHPGRVTRPLLAVVSIVLAPGCAWFLDGTEQGPAAAPTAIALPDKTPPASPSPADSPRPPAEPTGVPMETRAAATAAETASPTPTAVLARTTSAAPTAAKSLAFTASPTATATVRPSPATAATGSLVVTVGVIGPDRRQVPAADAVVWLPGSTRAGAVTGPARVSSRDKRFDPRVTVVARGGAVDFPNYDPINHNVFSTSEAATFDLGLYRNGDSKRQEFPRAGVVPVFCNIHPQMLAYVVVVDGAVYAKTGADGTVRFDGLPAGSHPVRVWHEKSREWSGEAVIAPGTPATLSVALDASSWRDVPHRRKDGSEYPPPDDDENRY